MRGAKKKVIREQTQITMFSCQGTKSETRWVQTTNPISGKKWINISYVGHPLIRPPNKQGEISPLPYPRVATKTGSGLWTFGVESQESQPTKICEVQQLPNTINANPFVQDECTSNAAWQGDYSGHIIKQNQDGTINGEFTFWDSVLGKHIGPTTNQNKKRSYSQEFINFLKQRPECKSKEQVNSKRVSK